MSLVYILYVGCVRCDIPFHSTGCGCLCPRQTGSPAAAWGGEPGWDRKAGSRPEPPSGLTETTPASSPADWNKSGKQDELITPVCDKTICLDNYTKGVVHCIFPLWDCHFNVFVSGSTFEFTVTDLRLMSSGGRTSWQEEPSLVRTENTCPLSLQTTSSDASGPLRLHSTENTMLVSRLHSSSSGVCCNGNNTQNP